MMKMRMRTMMTRKRKRKRSEYQSVEMDILHALFFLPTGLYSDFGIKTISPTRSISLSVTYK
jgi:hypothetical protein